MADNWNSQTRPSQTVTATTAPTTTDDGTKGWTVGSIWIDITNNHCYICTGNTTNAARWLTLG